MPRTVRRPPRASSSAAATCASGWPGRLDDDVGARRRAPRARPRPATTAGAHTVSVAPSARATAKRRVAHVGDHEARRPARRGTRGRQQADGAGADHHDAVGRRDGAALDGMQRARGRLGERAESQCHARQRMAEVGARGDELPVAAVAGEAVLVVVGAEVGAPGAARPARAAEVVAFDDDARPCRQVRMRGRALGDDAGPLVAGHDGEAA